MSVKSAGHGLSAGEGEDEQRLGSLAFCDAEAEAASVKAQHPGASLIAYRHGAYRTVLALGQSLRPDARETIARPARGGARDRDPLRRPAGSRRADRGRARHRACAGRPAAGRQAQPARQHGGERPQGADGRRRAQRRAGARRRACLALAGQRHPSRAGGGRYRLPRRQPRAGGRGARHLHGRRAG